MKTFLTSILIICLLPLLTTAKKQRPKAWTSAESALNDNPEFAFQGEYLGKEGDKVVAFQATVLKDKKFLVAKYKGGLPGL